MENLESPPQNLVQELMKAGSTLAAEIRRYAEAVCNSASHEGNLDESNLSLQALEVAADRFDELHNELVGSSSPIQFIFDPDDEAEEILEEPRESSTFTTPRFVTLTTRQDLEIVGAEALIEAASRISSLADIDGSVPAKDSEMSVGSALYELVHRRESDAPLEYPFLRSAGSVTVISVGAGNDLATRIEDAVQFSDWTPVILPEGNVIYSFSDI